MILSRNWLSEFVSLDGDFSKPEFLAQELTRAGLEVDGLDDKGLQFQHVVVGKVVELGKHPDADRLTLCQIDAGESGLRQIVCGAKNHKAGDKVVVAKPGAVLPGDFKIKESKIRGVESLGMLASESELGLSDESEGILILPEDAPVGESFAKYQGLDDVLYELSVTPNRADCLSHLGLAREVSALQGTKLKIPEFKFLKGSFSTSAAVQVEIKASSLCPRYSAALIKGVQVGPSPLWLKNRLELCGINSINNVVDITNFVMLEYGQPLHAFDLKEIRGGKISVELAKPGEKFVTLDGSELTLDGDELSIRDSERALALAGVIGGKNSGVSDETKDLVIESAHFIPSGVRKTSRKHGIETDSAYRFSRGTDPLNVVEALRRACQLIQKVAGGEVAESLLDENLLHDQKSNIEVSTDFVAQKLGFDVDPQKFQTWMERLGCRVETTQSQSLFRVKPPTFRWDLESAVDLVEEYGRLEGYDKIPEVLPQMKTEPLAEDIAFVNRGRLIDFLVGLGGRQAVNYGFLSGEVQEKMIPDLSCFLKAGLDSIGPAVKVSNPLNENTNVMRQSLIPGLISNVQDNIRYNVKSGTLFELGTVFSKAQEQGFVESERISVVQWGSAEGLTQFSHGRALFFKTKGILESLFRLLGIQSFQFDSLSEPPLFLHPGRSALVKVEGRAIGFIGEVHPALAADEKLTQSLALFELDFTKLMRGQPRQVKAQTPSRLPIVERDLSFVLSSSDQAEPIRQAIAKIDKKLISRVEVFDEFTGGALTDGQVSLTYRYYCEPKDQTLSEKQLSDLHEKILKKVPEQMGVQIR